MRLGTCLNERYEPIARVVNYSADARLASILAVSVVVLQDDHGLLLAFAGVCNVASVEVAVVTAVSADRTDAVLFLQQLDPKGFPLTGLHQYPSFSFPRSESTSTPSA